jgi:cytochrome c553
MTSIRPAVLVLVIVLGSVLAPPVAPLVVGTAFAGPLDHPGYPYAHSCSGCHGFAGNSRSDSMPILAGMAASYVKKAVEDYASGRRASAEMQPFAKAILATGHVDDVAGYFASQKREPTPVAVDSAAAARGRTAAQSCGLCHGPDGRGNEAALVPDLRAQPPGYLRTQMLLFKTGKRTVSDPRVATVKAEMQKLSDETIGDLAAFYASQR